VLASTSITFDLSVFEIFVPLAWGGTVILADNALALPKLPAAGEVRLVNTVPSAISELLRAGAVPRSVVTVNLAGEALSRAVSDRVYGEPTIERLYNLYGPSEDTTYSTWALIERESTRPPGIGRPVDGTEAWVLDARLNPLPVGVPGELYLGGQGLSRGYLGRPELTAERYVPDPFASRPGARLYRTGDLTRYRTDGSLEYLGRIDHQVKVRGFRIELGEVEAALNRLPGVETAVVMAREDGGEQRLVAYLVGAPGEEMTTAGLRQSLRQRLPEHMVPTAFVVLKSLPLTPNGKVDRRALPAPGASPQTGRPEIVAPRTPLEAQVAEIWTAVLNVDEVGIHDTFWDLGGHSLLATRVLARLYEALGVELPLQTLFEHPTLVELAAAVGQTLLSSGGEDVEQFLAELEELSEEEVRELLREESLELGP
jgi:acyl-coenzyme A synthetase/AMP-(fatty) acid ligase/acyl carrier protein